MNNNSVIPQSVWKEYEKDLGFKNSINLFEKVKNQQNFFLGKQWEGLNAPDLEKPVLNFIKRVVNYLISVLVVDDIGISFRNYQEPDQSYTPIKAEIERVNENTKFKAKFRNVIKNAAIDGDGCLYCRYNPIDEEIETQLISSTNLVFADRTCNEVEKQPYIIIVKRVPADTIKMQYPLFENNIKPDYYSLDMQENDELVTVLIKFYKKNGQVYFVQCTRDCMLTGETATGQRLYPIAFVSWENVRDCCHGMGAVETIIPNQIAVNKLWAMALLYQKNNAFPKVFVDKTKIEKWSNAVGAVIGVVGNPNEAIATSFRAQDMASQLMSLVEKTISYTKDFMGANDAALGNVSPSNTSAIMALQKSAAAPLELQRLALYQFAEDYIRILYDIMQAHYGIRECYSENGMEIINFAALSDSARLIIDIGPGEMWSESSQIQRMDNLFTKGIIDDAIIYLENLPASALPNKEKLIQDIRSAQAEKQNILNVQNAMLSENDNIEN